MRSHNNNVNRNPKCGRSHSKYRLVAISLMLLLSGVLLILGNSGIIDKAYFEYIFSWQSLLIAVGILLLSGGVREHWFGAMIMMSIGGVFLYDEIYTMQIGNANTIWPFLLIIIGLGLLIKIFLPNKNRIYNKKISGGKREITNDEYIDVSRVFSEANLMIQSESFKGGKASFVFAGGVIDLRSAKLAEGINILKIECVFGGIKIFLPEDWDVSLETSGVFGGFNDDRRHVQIENLDRTKKLIIKAEAVFGGGEIYN